MLRRRAPQSHDGDDDAPIAAAANGSLERNANVERDREIWASAGILVNELARPVLFLNLPTREVESDRWRAGEPSYASLRSLLRAPPAWEVAKRIVYVCENPNLVAIAADHWGSDCAPLVCTDGMPRRLSDA